MDFGNKKRLVKSVLKFLKDELHSDMLEGDNKESIEVAVQCLESAYSLESDSSMDDKDIVNLLVLIGDPVSQDVSEADKEQAELHKAKGNDYMKSALYTDALAEYTKAISLFSGNAVYYCNRAAAYSRLERHLDAINDCKKAISLDPTYSRAYGRLGIAYSNLERFDESRQAYKEALRLDPNNTMYESNLKLAEEKVYSTMENAAPPEHRPLDISQFMNNPNLVNMATQMLADPGFRQMMTGLMSGMGQGDPSLDVLIQAGHDLAARMQNSNSELVGDLRRTLNSALNSTNSQTRDNPADEGKNDEQSDL